MVSVETPRRRAQVALVLSELLRCMGQGEVPLEFEEREDGQLAVAMHIASADSPLKAASQKRSPLLNALQFLLNRLLKRDFELQQAALESTQPMPGEAEPTAPTCGKVLLGIDEFPRRAAPPPPPPPKAPEAEVLPAEVVPAQAVSAEDCPATSPCENAEQVLLLANGLAQKCITHGRTYAVLFLSRAQRACMKQAASNISGLRAFSEGEAHWSRLVFEPEKPTPMPQKNRIALDKEGLANKSPKALAGRS